MARQTQVGIEEIQRDKQLRDQATTIAEYRKAPSVILPHCGVTRYESSDCFS